MAVLRAVQRAQRPNLFLGRGKAAERSSIAAADSLFRRRGHRRISDCQEGRRWRGGWMEPADLGQDAHRRSVEGGVLLDDEVPATVEERFVGEAPEHSVRDDAKTLRSLQERLDGPQKKIVERSGCPSIRKRPLGERVGVHPDASLERALTDRQNEG